MLRGNCTSDQKFACFLLLFCALKITKTFLKKKYASYSKLSKELKNNIEFK